MLGGKACLAPVKVKVKTAGTVPCEPGAATALTGRGQRLCYIQAARGGDLPDHPSQRPRFTTGPGLETRARAAPPFDPASTIGC